MLTRLFPSPCHRLVKEAAFPVLMVTLSASIDARQDKHYETTTMSADKPAEVTVEKGKVSRQWDSAENEMVISTYPESKSGMNKIAITVATSEIGNYEVEIGTIDLGDGNIVNAVLLDKWLESYAGLTGLSTVLQPGQYFYLQMPMLPVDSQGLITPVFKVLHIGTNADGDSVIRAQTLGLNNSRPLKQTDVTANQEPFTGSICQEAQKGQLCYACQDGGMCKCCMACHGNVLPLTITFHRHRPKTPITIEITPVPGKLISTKLSSASVSAEDRWVD